MTTAPRTDSSRCPWAPPDDPLYARYHDEEWGRPLVDDRALFELLVLESFQAGLSWITILRKREAFREAFARFDPVAIARFDERQIGALVQDAGIVRHRGKIEATIANARAALALRAETTLRDALWSSVDGKPLDRRPRTMADVPAETPESRALATRLRALGFRFLGPTTCYSLMQAAGLVNDHLVTCSVGRALRTSMRQRDHERTAEGPARTRSS